MSVGHLTSATHEEAGIPDALASWVVQKTETHEVSQIDCTKINVAKNIQKEWFDYAEKHNIDKTDLAMGICFSGPKALDTLPDNTVEILDGCLTYKPIAETKITDRTDKPRE